MATTTQREAATAAMPALEMFPASRLVSVIAIVAMVMGLGSVLGGLAGATYTYQQAAAQGVTTPDDAQIPGVEVRGPLSMWAQQDIITHHQLGRTDGLYYAQMERQVPMLDEAGEPVVDEAGEVVMVPNEARNAWITATTLTTALSVGIMAYALSAFAVVVGLTLAGVGLVLFKLRRSLLAMA